jgi:predicted RNA-binding Zn-ribbon protein involved in translation (DUF1610 family)
MFQVGDWIIIFLTVLVVIAVIILTRRWRSRPELVCPQCGSEEVIETSRQTLGSRTIERIGSGTPAGGDIRVQLDLEVTYHCQNCGEKIVRRFTETQ